MNKRKIIKPFRHKRRVLAVGCLLPFLIVMCRNAERQVQRDKLDNKIATLDKEISETRDLRTARVPKHLRETQKRYNVATDSLETKYDSLDFYMNQNDSLLARAFDNYATRVGRDFQISRFLPQNDIATFQKQIAALDSMDFVTEMARRRILQNTGSLHDLSYFFEMIDFDSVNAELQNKLAWNFYTDSVSADDEAVELAVLNFENPALNDALQSETNLLNNAWSQNKNNSVLYIDNINISDSGTHVMTDTTNHQPENEITKCDVPNFDIPEFDSVRAPYMRNDSMINIYNKEIAGIFNAQDSLEHYRQEMIRTRDSLIAQRKSLEK